MATKTSLISAVNAQITAVIDDVKHRQSMLEVINELFPTTHTMSYTAVVDTEVSYDLTFTKIGNLVTINGIVTNGSSSILTSGELITIDNSLYFAKTGYTAYLTCFTDLSSSRLYIDITNDKIILASSGIPADNSFRINATYLTND